MPDVFTGHRTGHGIGHMPLSEDTPTQAAGLDEEASSSGSSESYEIRKAHREVQSKQEMIARLEIADAAWRLVTPLSEIELKRVNWHVAKTALAIRALERSIAMIESHIKKSDQ